MQSRPSRPAGWRPEPKRGPAWGLGRMLTCTSVGIDSEKPGPAGRRARTRARTASRLARPPIEATAPFSEHERSPWQWSTHYLDMLSEARLWCRRLQWVPPWISRMRDPMGGIHPVGIIISIIIGVVTSVTTSIIISIIVSLRVVRASTLTKPCRPAPTPRDRRALAPTRRPSNATRRRRTHCPPAMTQRPCVSADGRRCRRAA